METVGEVCRLGEKSYLSYLEYVVHDGPRLRWSFLVPYGGFGE